MGGDMQSTLRIDASPAQVTGTAPTVVQAPTASVVAYTSPPPRREAVDVVLITGIAGQDGIEMSRFLKTLNPNVRIIGVDRRHAREYLPHIAAALERYVDEIVRADVTDYHAMLDIIRRYRPDHVYHFAAQSFVAYSFENPSATYENNIMGTLSVLSAVADAHPTARVYFAGSSEMWGRPATTPQNEDTPFNPRSPYAVSKVAGFYTARYFREAHGMFVASGITSNHEGEFRGHEFVTQKIATWAAKLKLGRYEDIRLGNLDARKDWGWAGDFVDAFHRMLMAERPREYAIGTGVQHTVRDFVEAALAAAGFRARWGDEGGSAWDGETRVALIRIDPKLIRPLESDNYQVDASRIRRELGWEPKVTFEGLAHLMVYAAERRIQMYGYRGGRMGEVPDYTGVFRMDDGGVSYTARAIRCGDRLAVVVADEFIRNWGLKEGDWVTVRLNYVGSLGMSMMELKNMVPAWLRRLIEENGDRIPDLWYLPRAHGPDFEEWLQWLSQLSERVVEEARRRGQLPGLIVTMGDGSVRVVWEDGSVWAVEGVRMTVEDRHIRVIKG